MRTLALLAVMTTACLETQAQRQPNKSAPTARTQANEKVVGHPCEGCEHVFLGKPTTLASQGSIAPPGTAGEPLKVTGVVRDLGGRAVAGIIIFAYQTGADGIYPNSTPANRQGDNRGWVVSDEDGRFTFLTVRPGSYPVPSAPPKHIHMHIIEPGRCTYYIADIEFTDDPRFRRTDGKRGGTGVSTPLRKEGIWRVHRNIVLGADIPGYAKCDD